MELRARAYRLLIRRQTDPHFDFFSATRAGQKCFLASPLRDTQVALVSTAGLFLRGQQEPFSLSPGRGDPSFREIPLDAPLQRCSMTPGRFASKAFDVHPEVLWPVRAMHRAHQAEQIGVAPMSLSFHGHIPDPDRLVSSYAPTAAQRLIALGAGAVIVVGACALGAQTAGILASVFESAGLPSVALTQWPKLARRAGAARAVGSPFPFGMTMGPPGVAPLHDWLLGRALSAFSAPLATRRRALRR